MINRLAASGHRTSDRGQDEPVFSHRACLCYTPDMVRYPTEGLPSGGLDEINTKLARWPSNYSLGCVFSWPDYWLLATSRNGQALIRGTVV